MEKLRRGKDFSSSCLPAILTFSFSHPFPYPISYLLLQGSLQRAALSRRPPCLLHPRGKEMPERVLCPLRQSLLTGSFLHLHCSMLPATSCCPAAMGAGTKRQHCQKKRGLLLCPIQHPSHNQQQGAQQLLRFSSLPESTKRKGGAATGDALVKTRWRKVVQTLACLLFVELKPSATVANSTHAYSDTNQLQNPTAAAQKMATSHPALLPGCLRTQKPTLQASHAFLTICWCNWV